MKYLIHLLPPADLSEKIIRLQRDLKLRETSNVPHCTLYGARLDERKEMELIADLDRISHEPFRAEMGDFAEFDDDAFVMRVEDSRSIRVLHYQVIECLKKYVDWKKTELYTGEPFREQLSREYCSAYVAGCYNPHITIGHGSCGSRLPNNPLKGFAWNAASFRIAKKTVEWTHLKEFGLWLPD